MSTSPSWFDQEKFSRLVKKVGPKTPPPVEPAQPSAPAASAPTPASVTTDAPADEPPQGMASTARISLVSKPPSLMSEQRALPTLPRRTSSLPGLKSLFESAPKIESEAPPRTDEPIRAEEPIRADEPIRAEEPIRAPEPAFRAPPIPEESKEENLRATGPLPSPLDKTEDIRSEAPPAPVGETPTPAPTPEAAPEEGGNNIEAIWQKMALLNEELAQTIHERDQAVSDANLLREQLRVSEDSLQGNKSAEATKEEFARLVRERDDALAQSKALKSQLDALKPSAPPTFGKAPADMSKTKELVLLTGERDLARKEYAELRKQYESLKQGASTGQLPSPADSAKARKELEQQVEGFRVKLEEKNREITLLKAAGGGEGGDNSKLLDEITSLREQITKLKDEASVAQRGLALSQKALHETRETLREATEGTSLSRHNFDNLKSEVAALTQQNSMLQSQNEQLTRELAAAKSKLTSRV